MTTDEDAFHAAIAALHGDEADPEYMIQDHEGIPPELYGESGLDARVWAWLELDDSERDICAAYWAHVDDAADISTAHDAYMGTYESPEDWAAEWLEDCGELASVPESLRNYIDFESYARDAEIGGDVCFVEMSYNRALVFSRR